jgi:hypothetical protein
MALTLDLRKNQYQYEVKCSKALGRDILRMGKFQVMYMTLCGCKDLA